MAKPVRPSYTARPGEAIRVFRDDDGGFAIGAGWITIASDDMCFVADVINDLARIVHSPDSEAVLRQIDAIGHPIRISKPEQPTEPPNAWTQPDDLAAATPAGVPLSGRGSDSDGRIGTGTGCGSTIVYDPMNWPQQGDRRSPSSSEILMLMLRQAHLNATGRSNRSASDWGADG